MTRVISTATLRSQLDNLLDELSQGQTHFIIQRDDDAAAVLLSMDKFQEIVQMLEMLNSLDYIATDEIGLDGGLEALSPTPQLTTRRGGKNDTSDEARARSASLREEAARLGIHVIK